MITISLKVIEYEYAAALASSGKLMNQLAFSGPGKALLHPASHNWIFCECQDC